MNAQDLLEDFSCKPPQWRFERLVAVMRDGPAAELERFLELVMIHRPTSGTYFDMAISHVPDEALDRLVPMAMAGLESEGPHEAHESLLAYASLQRPEALHPHLPRLFALSPNDCSYYENWPWRDAGMAAIPFLVGQLRAASEDVRAKARDCLLELRLPEAFSRAEASAVELAQMGFGSLSEAVYTPAGAHLVFRPDHFGRELPIWMTRDLHPSWRLASAGGPYRFGGDGASACALCGGQLHHLITVPASRVFPGAGPATVSLETCLGCVGPAVFYRHDENGRPRSLHDGPTAPAAREPPLKEGWVGLAPTPARLRWQDWALANGRENLHRLGGYPCWIQSAEYPSCALCGQTMHFLLQLDSDLPTATGGEWLWGSGGICYGFRCAPCRTTAFTWQCT